MRKLRTLRTLAVAAAVTAGALITGAAEPSATAGTSNGSGATVHSPAGVTLTGPDAAGFRLHQQRQLAADVHLTAWTNGRTTVRTTTRPDSQVRVDLTRGRITVDATQNSDIEGRSADQLAARHQRRGMPAAEQQIAMGMDPHRARATFGTEGTRFKEGPIIDEWCVDIDAEDGLLHSHGCTVRHLDQDDSNGRYLADEMVTSAVSKDYDSWFPYGLTRVDSILIYGGDDKVIRWDPISDKPISECSEVEVEVGGEGGGVAVSTPICPDTFGPSTIPSDDKEEFGAAWSGPQSDPGLFMATQGVTLVKEKNHQATTLRNEIRYTW